VSFAKSVFLRFGGTAGPLPAPRVCEAQRRLCWGGRSAPEQVSLSRRSAGGESEAVAVLGRWEHGSAPACGCSAEAVRVWGGTAAVAV